LGTPRKYTEFSAPLTSASPSPGGFALQPNAAPYPAKLSIPQGPRTLMAESLTFEIRGEALSAQAGLGPP